MRRKKTEPEDLLAAVAAAADDGFCLASSLRYEFRELGHRDLVRLRGRAVSKGLLLERRGPDGRIYLALTSEGWRALRPPAEDDSALADRRDHPRVERGRLDDALRHQE